MRDYHLPMEHVIYDLPMAQGWTLIAWAQERNPWVTMESVTDGYIAQEIGRRLQ